MTSLELAPLPELPMQRPEGRPFDPPAELARIREEAPLRRMRFPDGHIGWLATGHAEVRAVLADQRFSSRYELLHLPYQIGGVQEIPPAAPGDLSGVDAPQHTRYRRLLAGKFTVRRMRQLTERIEEVTAETLDAMDRHGPPVDLVTAYAQPVPAPIICEMLGVPYADREQFQAHAMTMTGLNATAEERMRAWVAVTNYIGRLVRTKRANPTDDLLSDMTDSDLSDDELAGLGAFLLGAGLDTTANMLALGFFALTQHPDQLAAWRQDPDLTDQAVEELMRYLSITPTGARAALEDVELDGQLIKGGETVALSVQAANRDPRRFPNPDTLDISRKASGHLGFGFGIHQCLGQHLARSEMRVAFPALVDAKPKSEVAAGLSADVERVRVGEAAWVTVGRLD
ncbi:MAG TPA: cytochrome P450, partial [Mycobacterium sp.]|nr:cytochrome P450 [Mycobacterium sp.]